MNVARFEVTDVRAALAVVDVFRAAGAELVGRGREVRTRVCPSCGPRSRPDAVAVNAGAGLWRCHVCGEGGDALDALAAFRGLDVRQDFARVIEFAAELAGVAPEADPAAGAARRVEAARKRAAELERAAASERARVARANEVAQGVWSRLDRRNDRGEAYLTGRGLAPGPLVARDLVRFHRDGAPAVALHSSRGAIRNVVHRALAPSPNVPKERGLAGCPTAGTLVGTASAIGAGVDVVLCEGLADALAAALAWPNALVLGAHGADNYAAIAAVAAPLVAAAAGARLRLCVDADAAGMRAGCAAVQVAIAAGRAVGRDLVRMVEVVDLADHHDLADAYAAGWRP